MNACANCQQPYINSFKFEEGITDQAAFGELIDPAGFKEKDIENNASYERLDFTAKLTSIKDEMTFEKLLLQSDGDLVLSRDMRRFLNYFVILINIKDA